MIRASYLDNHTYVERRVQDADEAEARILSVSAQAARRHVAIEQAVKRIRAIKREQLLTRASVDELIEEIAHDLEKANHVRAHDQEERCL
jgi:hypothetical protein